ncbi:MAG: 5-(carboxyamino)imidazole ribonucleotide mutase [Fimbriimonadaceae bacterium]|nr:5-(carboxyamino)imidazole ribonucleotide mutase [Fimbriimonadaceae bacterium]
MAAGPRVGILMGSDSDLGVMEDAAKALNELGVSWELTVLSAHRNPEGVRQYALTAPQRGLQVLIAAAGGAAHLPGVVAASTTLPVIGVPILTAALGGADALYSIVQMPPGVPVATVGLNAARNAAILAVQMLALGEPALRLRLEQFKGDLLRQNEAKNAKAQERVAALRGE